VPAAAKLKITPLAGTRGGLDAEKCWRGCPVTPPFAYDLDDPPNADSVPFGPPRPLRIAGADNKKQVDTIAWSGGRTNCMLIPRAVSQRTLWSPGSNLSPGASKEAISFACSTPPHAPIRASRSLGFAIGRERSSRAARTCGAWTYPDPADATRRVTADRENRPAVACSRVDARSLGSRSSGGFTGEIFRGETRFNRPSFART
jgi:hypothetical protein